MKIKPSASTYRWGVASLTAVAGAVLVSCWPAGVAQAATCNVLLHTSALSIEDGSRCAIQSEQKVFLEKGIGTTLEGNVGSQKGKPIVDFTSTSLLQAASGFANIAAKGSHSYQELTISVAPTNTSAFTFTGLEFSARLGKSPTNLTIEAFDASNELLGELILSKSQLKRATNTSFLVLAGLTDPISKVVLISSGFVQTKHFEISGLHDPPLQTTPVPAALPLFATGLGALGLFGWRRTRKMRTQPRSIQAE